jgi:hypothetical protein
MLSAAAADDKQVSVRVNHYSRLYGVNERNMQPTHNNVTDENPALSLSFGSSLPAIYNFIDSKETVQDGRSDITTQLPVAIHDVD